MAIFRVERNKSYTVMSNHHLRNKELTLKAKGLLSQMLSLPDDWDYTLKGLSLINREKIDAIREAVRELERAGYIVRNRTRDEKGRLRGSEYIIYEQPRPPDLDLPVLENPTLEKPMQENPMQLNKDIYNTDLLNTESIPFPSSENTEWKRREAVTEKEMNSYRKLIQQNIEYDYLLQDSRIDQTLLNEVVELILETVCSARETIRIAGDDYPAEMVKSKFMDLKSSHIQYIFDCLHENTTKIRNMKQYLKAVLFNAPTTIDNYYAALVNHDIHS